MVSFPVFAREVELQEPKQQVIRVQKHLVVGACDGMGDLPGSFNLSEGEKSRVVSNVWLSGWIRYS
jgi:hypothetical protein